MIKKFKNKLLGKRIVLKKLEPNIEMAKIIFTTVALNRRRLRLWFPWEKTTKKIEDSLQYLFMVEDRFTAGKGVDYGIYLGNKYIGNIGVFDVNDKNKSGEIGYWLDEKFTRQGYMTEAVKLLEKESFTNMGLNRIQIKCDERNVASAAVAKKCGYIFEGQHREDAYSEHFGNLRNTLYFSKLKSEFKKK